MEIKRNTVPGTPAKRRDFVVGDRVRGLLSGTGHVIVSTPSGYDAQYRTIKTSGESKGRPGFFNIGAEPNFEFIDPQPGDVTAETPATTTYTITASEAEYTLLRKGIAIMGGATEEEVLGRNDGLRFRLHREFNKGGA